MMRPKEFKFSMMLLMLLITTVSLRGQSYTKENMIEKSFPIYEDTEIEISNKYGDITIESWEKDSVKIVVNYKVTSTKEVKLNKTYDAISVDFKANKFYIVAATEFNGKGSFWSDVSDIASNLFTGGTNTSIDYTVYTPDDKHINLNLKYGNVYFANHYGKVKLALSNGDLKAHNLMGDTELNVEFGDVTINNLVDGKVRLSYGTLNLEEADNLSITGQSSEYEMIQVNSLTIDSKRDKIIIDEVVDVTGSTYFSRLDIDKLLGSIDVKSKYGSFKLKEVGKTVNNIKLDHNNTSVNIYLQKENNYKIDLISDEKADVTYSANLGDFSIEEIKGKETLVKARCLYGVNNKAIPIRIDIRSGFLSIKLED